MRRCAAILGACACAAALSACVEEWHDGRVAVTAARAEDPSIGITPRLQAEREPSGLDALRLWLSSGGEPQLRHVELLIQSANEPILPNPVIIKYDDPRIRHLGGRHSQPLTWPRNLMWWPQAVTTSVSPVFETNGYSYDRSSLFDGYQFILPAGQDQFEIFSLDDGHIGGVYVEIDGLRTSIEPLSFGHQNGGARRWTHVSLPPSFKRRDIRILTGRASIGEVRLPSGHSLASRNPDWDRKPKVVIVGDSISEGQGAGHGADSWAINMAYRLGIDNPVNVSLGGTGYLQRAGDRPNFREHIGDVTEAFPGAQPDVAIVAGGINDCARFAPMAIGTEARTYFEALRSAAPEMEIVVFGPFAGPNGYDAQLALCSQAVRDAAGHVPGTHFLDVSGWVTAENSDRIFNGDGADPHPTPAGHTYYAKLGEQAIRDLLDSLLPGEAN